MIDYIRAHFINKNEVEANFANREDLKMYKGTYDLNTHKIEYPSKTPLDNMVVKFTEQSGIIENSIHKKFNNVVGNGGHNFNDFSYCDLVYVLGVLRQELGISLLDTHLTQFEFGFNIKLQHNPSQILKNNILMYKYKAPCVDPKNLKNKKIKKFIFNNYEIKVYDKSLQFGLKKDFNNDILRIEVKYKSKKEFNKLGVFSLEDFLNIETLQRVFFNFMLKIESLMIVDSYEGNSLMTKKESDFFVRCTNPNYWNQLHDNFHRNTVFNYQVKFENLVKKYSLDNWKIEINDLLIKKFNELINNNCYENIISKCA